MSKRKHRRKVIPLTQDDFKAHLKQQIEFLKKGCNSYDKGFFDIAKHLALVVRVLVHDTPKSTSLLTHLNKKNILFCDTALDFNPNNLLPHLGLIRVKGTVLGLGLGAGAYEAMLDDLLPSITVKKEPYIKWWKKPVIVERNQEIELTRKDLVLAVTNQDGGAHVDHNLDEDYAKLTKFNALGYNIFINGKLQPMIVGPELASIRQIAHEVLKSLKDEFPEYSY